MVVQTYRLHDMSLTARMPYHFGVPVEECRVSAARCVCVCVCPALWSAGPVLPHLAFCGGEVARVVAKAPQLRSLSLSRCELVAG